MYQHLYPPVYAGLFRLKRQVFYNFYTGRKKYTIAKKQAKDCGNNSPDLPAWVLLFYFRLAGESDRKFL